MKFITLLSGGQRSSAISTISIPRKALEGAEVESVTEAIGQEVLDGIERA